jgi:hypothetical protein
MTGPEHICQADSWLFKATHADARGDGETAESCANAALAHATLALTAATVQQIKGTITEDWAVALS